MALDEREVVTSLGLGGLGRGQQWGVVLTCAKTVHIYTYIYTIYVSTGGGAGYRAGDAPPDGDPGPSQEEAKEEQDKIVSHQSSACYISP